MRNMRIETSNPRDLKKIDRTILLMNARITFQKRFMLRR